MSVSILVSSVYSSTGEYTEDFIDFIWKEIVLNDEENSYRFED